MRITVEESKSGLSFEKNEKAHKGMAGDSEKHQFGKQGLPVLTDGPWLLLGPAKAYFTTTEGGAAINQQFQALDEDGQPIPGLYAVGQNGLGGQILWGHGLHICWAVTSGRLVGEILTSQVSEGDRIQ